MRVEVSNGMIIESSILRDVMLTRTRSGKFAAILFTLRTAKAQTVIESMDKLKRDAIYL